MYVKNKKAFFEYTLTDSIEVGIVLKGNEVKLIQENKIDLTGSYVDIEKNEVWLLNSTVSGVNFDKFFQKHKIGDYPLIDSVYTSVKRPRKLLLHKNEIEKYKKMLTKGYTLIVSEMYSDKNNRIKCTLNLAKGKKLHDKREAIKQRDLERSLKNKDFKE